LIPRGRLWQQVRELGYFYLGKLIQVILELDHESIAYARKNVTQNRLQDRITIAQAWSEGPILLPLHSSQCVLVDIIASPSGDA
jgi:hypothetical protein